MAPDESMIKRAQVFDDEAPIDITPQGVLG
jgi:hypothetical protein